jgi:hypothetical protein
MSIHADAAAQTITGYGVGVGDSTLCTYCKAELGEGDPITAYAYRRAGEQVVNVARLYCADCDRTAIEHPSRGCHEWLADARLAFTSDVAHQSHSLTLVGVEIVAESSPDNGDTL